MSMPRRLLLQTMTTTSTSAESASSTAALSPAPPMSPDSNVVVILAALLCAVICVVGLALVARCAWLRRNSTGGASAAVSSAAALPPPSPNKGVKKKVLRSIPTLSFQEAFAVPSSAGGHLSSDCAICLAEFADGDEIRVLPQCGHGFHVGCVDVWLRSHSSCPSCRSVLVAATSGRCCRRCGVSEVAGDAVVLIVAAEGEEEEQQEEEQERKVGDAGSGSDFLP